MKAETVHKIVAKPLRGKRSKVSLWSLGKEDRNMYMAFCFEVNNLKYFAAANTETSKLQVEQLKDLDDVDSKFLFRWGDPNRGDDWNNLCSLAEPSKYLSVSGKAFTLSSSQETLFKFTCERDKCKLKSRRMVSNRLSR
ncbi:hypothetical protein AMEX_G25590 [Astyanax mexicanus]|uniref:Uncharacterized protein n=1 Tax=Astyanax mexicanus TaxID=7994 RepID=A0A8T2KW85_ASTMX|nr:hypothetical protein AMEX_G25590 [Astyanax mexicanus]